MSTSNLMRLRSEEELEILRENLEKYDAARRIRDGIVRSADFWVGRSDDFLRDLIPGPEVPRSFYVNFKGCPVHGKKTRGIRDHSWGYDPFVDRWKVICPIGGESYPSNDFSAFYKSGMKDRSLLTGDYPDDGWGWRKEDEEFKYWFIGYCCQALWGRILSAVSTLSRAYVLTCEGKYAHKALVMLGRIADVYPEMDYSTQSMYAEEASPGYAGKIGGLIGETGTVRNLCEAYDNVRGAIQLDEEFSKNAEGVKAHLEEHLVGVGIRGIYEGDVRGNYGGHQMALLVAAITLGDEKKLEEAIDWVMDNTGEATTLKEMRTVVEDFIFRDKAGHAEGLNFALDNLIFREGIGWESSPGYCSGWVSKLAHIGEILSRLGVEVFDRPKFKRMFYWPFEMVCIDKFTPAIGDVGSVTDGMIQLSSDVARIGFERYGDLVFADILLSRGHYGEGSLESYEDLFRRPLDQAELEKVRGSFKRQPLGSHNMGGYGLAILRSGEGTAVSVYYGRSATEHGHFDKLSLELFAYGRKMIPDLGYPEVAMEAKKPAAWTKNTACHNTVVVDERRQDTQAPGHIRGFIGTTGLQYLDVSSPNTYTSVSLYRRETALVDITPQSRYVLDVFRVEGGDRHDYSIHGFGGEFSTEGIGLSEPAEKGTLAGEDVEFGELYDEADLDRPYKNRSYYTYRGSGYSYLYDVQKGVPRDAWSALWRAGDEEIGLRITFLPTSTKEVVVATGQPPLRSGAPEELKYVLLRNWGQRVKSSFTSLIEPFEGAPKIRSVNALSGSASQGNRTDLIALKIHHHEGIDYLLSSLDEDILWDVEDGLAFKGRFGLLRLTPEGQLLHLKLIGSGQLSIGGNSVEIEGPLCGRISDVDYEDRSVEVQLDQGSQDLDLSGALVGETVVIHNNCHLTSYGIADVSTRDDRHILYLDETFRIGKAPVDHIDPDGTFFVTNTYLYLAAQGYYRGTRLVDETGTVSLEIEDVKLVPHKEKTRRDGKVTVVDRVSLHDLFQVGDMAYIYDFGPGDKFYILPHVSAIRKEGGTFDFISNCLFSSGLL